VAGAYEETHQSDDPAEIPACFTDPQPSAQDKRSRLLVIDSASDIGGTWAEERLYPNLLSQNSYGLYEFSDLPLAEVVPEDKAGGDDTRNQFIAGWKISRYLQAWAAKWKLERHIRLNWTVRRLHAH
jgi:cation diffusion facilitator CzcD-associated flavoprotein CzcO